MVSEIRFQLGYNRQNDTSTWRNWFLLVPFLVRNVSGADDVFSKLWIRISNGRKFGERV
jgi:hypothetical protein